MTDSATTRIPAQHLAKVRRDLDTCNKTLAYWYADSSLETTDAGEILHTAVEALMRAVATLAQVVEDQQA
jgi:hypothetical protein